MLSRRPIVGTAAPFAAESDALRKGHICPNVDTGLRRFETGASFMRRPLWRYYASAKALSRGRSLGCWHGRWPLQARQFAP